MLSNDQIWIISTFVVFLLLFIVVGAYSSREKQTSVTDYLLASRQVNPWFTALSAMATGQSGLLFIGQVGFAYTSGLSTIWLTIGWAIGDYLAWWFVFKPLRTISEAQSIDTVSSFLGQEKKGNRWITLTAALITIAFLGSYAAAQLTAGGKALNVIFGWENHWGIIMGAVIVVIYCFSGGIRASIWTDTVQAIIMIASLFMLFTVSLIKCGGWIELWVGLKQIDTSLVSLSPTSTLLGIIPFFLGWTVAGFGVVGQPHIMIRAMAIDSANNIAFARNLKTACGLFTSFNAIGIGLTARLLLPELMTKSDPELALPYLSIELLPAVLVGLMLAGLFSATISTADSQILSCSAALTQDILPKRSNSYRLAKMGTLVVTAITLIIALGGEDSVFALITFSWSALASGLGPLLVLRVWGKTPNTVTSILMMLTGIATALVWNYSGLSTIIYEVLPGMTAGIGVYWLSQLFIKQDLNA